MNPRITILSPARDLQVGLAAIQAGADAIYIGGPAFGAREKAGNSVEDIATLCAEAHRYGVQVLITLNTLLSKEEREQAVSIAHALDKVGADAYIVQDLKLAERLIADGLRVHASTQCDNRTIEDVRARRDMGFSRVVLARELGIAEIRAIHEAVPDVELEAFVHGALCVSYSGRCYMSEVLMGRSANRGACAQMCRMRYDLLDASGNEVLDERGEPIHQRYLLSLQDMDRSLHLSELIEAGVTTLKIEGRLKDEDYVTNVTAYYRQLIDGLGIAGASHASEYVLDFRPNPEKTFHRGGIDYFLHGRTPKMANHHTPKSTGEYIGKVAGMGSQGTNKFADRSRGKTIDLRLEDGVTLHNGDGISIGDEGFNINGVTEGATYGVTRIVPSSMPKGIHTGMAVYRNLDVEFAKHLHAERKVPADITLEEVAEGYRLTLHTDYATREQVFEAEHITAQNPEKAVATARQQLSKLGDTCYVARTIEILTDTFIPAGVLNAWRRELTQA